jgi:hypothetical protein
VSRWSSRRDQEDGQTARVQSSIPVRLILRFDQLAGD